MQVFFALVGDRNTVGLSETQLLSTPYETRSLTALRLRVKKSRSPDDKIVLSISSHATVPSRTDRSTDPLELDSGSI